MDISLFLVLMFSLQIVYWVIGRLGARRLKGNKDYFLAGKSATLFPLMMTFFATQVGGGLILGAAEEAYHFGWSVLAYPFGASLGLILLGLWFGRKFATFNVSTIAQVLEVVYGSALLKKIASVLSMLSLFMVLVAQVMASHKFLMSVGMTSNLLFVLLWVIVILYTSQGGLKAVISTDVAQGLIFAIVLAVCLGVVAFLGGGLSSLEQTVNFSLVSSKLCGWLLMPLIFVLIGQDMGQRCFAGKSPRTVAFASVGAGLLAMVVCTIPVAFGVLAKSLGLEVPPGSSVLFTVIAKLTNPWFSAALGCAVWAVIVSTATAMINAIGSNLLGDFAFKGSMRVVRSLTLVISGMALVVAFYFNNIVNLLIQTYELSAGCLFVPVFFALFKKRGRFLSAFLAMCSGIFGFFLFRVVDIGFPKELATIGLSFLGYSCGEIWAWRRNRKTIAEITS